MKRLLIITGIILLASCIQRDLPLCEDENDGSVTVRVFVERFADEALLSRADIRATSESLFRTRVKKLDYYLYKDDVLVESGPVDNPHEIEDEMYVFQRANLPAGEYKLAFLANCVEDVIRGDFNRLDDVTINFPGIDKTDDYFIDVFPFTVSDKGTYVYDTQLKRLHGVVRYTFTDIDPDIKAIEVSMTGLTSSGCIMGTYSQDFSYTKKIRVNQTLGRAATEESTIVASFPTMAEGKSTWSVKLYNDDGDVAFYQKVISENVQVLRNRLLDLSAILKKGEYEFKIGVNTDWTGGSDEGAIIIK